MYPYKILGDFDLYAIMITLGAMGCLLLCRWLCDRRGLSAGVTNLALSGGLIGIACGLGTAVLFQAFYNFLDTGSFSLSGETGATFYGGLIGGALGFVLWYFVGARWLCPRGEHRSAFFAVAGVAACGITLAHGFGRIGCLMAGCCHGAPTDAWYGIYMVNLGYRAVPTQLFEAIFLFSLCGALVWLTLCRRRAVFATYLAVYGVFRFFLEYLRGDDRGASGLAFLSPSQLTACLMLLVALALFLLERRLCRPVADAAVATPDAAPAADQATADAAGQDGADA